MNEKNEDFLPIWYCSQRLILDFISEESHYTNFTGY